MFYFLYWEWREKTKKSNRKKRRDEEIENEEKKGKIEECCCVKNLDREIEEFGNGHCYWSSAFDS